MEHHRKEFWDRLDDIRTGMLEVAGRYVPMTLSTEPEDGRIWFLTARGTDPADAATANQATRFIVANDREGIYADIRGRLSVSTDRRILDEVWNPIATTWFEGGKEDPDLVLVCLTPETAEVWLGPESGLEALVALAKARLGGEREDLGAQFTLSFAKTSAPSV